MNDYENDPEFKDFIARTQRLVDKIDAADAKVIMMLVRNARSSYANWYVLLGFVLGSAGYLLRSLLA